jgi:hypothetical protein
MSIIVAFHYLHSMPGGSQLCFGVFLGPRILGALVLGCGPAHAYKLVEGAAREDCMTLTRLWLSDELPANSESRIISAMIRALRKYTSVKFLISYADPAAGHFGTIYQATNWTYTGLSEAMPYYDLGDGVARHSRSLSHAFGTQPEALRIKGCVIKDRASEWQASLFVFRRSVLEGQADGSGAALPKERGLTR